MSSMTSSQSSASCSGDETLIRPFGKPSSAACVLGVHLHYMLKATHSCSKGFLWGGTACDVLDAGCSTP